jgi:hypothetical protein
MLIHTCTDLSIPTCAACYQEDREVAESIAEIDELRSR